MLLLRWRYARPAIGRLWGPGAFALGCAYRPISGRFGMVVLLCVEAGWTGSLTMSIKHTPRISKPWAPLTASRCATRAPRSCPISTIGTESRALLEVRLISVRSASIRMFPMVSLSFTSTGLLAPYPGRSAANTGASDGSKGIRCLHLML